MSQIIVNPAELRTSATQLQNKANEMRAAINQVNSAMNAPRGMKSARVQRNVADWDAIMKQLVSGLDAATQASQIINKTANDIEIANQ